MIAFILKYWKAFAAGGVAGAIPTAMMAIWLHGVLMDVQKASCTRQIDAFQTSIVAAEKAGAQARERAEHVTKNLSRDDVVRDMSKHGWLRRDEDR